MSYRCASCPYSSDRRDSLLRHVQRKYGNCKLDVDLIQKCEKEASFACRNQGCNKVFKHTTNRHRHEVSCKFREHKVVEPTDSPVSSPTATSSMDINTMSSPNIAQGNSNSISDSHNVTNNNITININSFDTSVPKPITVDEFIKGMTKAPTEYLLSCIKDFHFNPEKPENMNVFISNLKDKIARVYNGEIWEVRDSEIVTDTLFDIFETLISGGVERFAEDEILRDKTVNQRRKWSRSADRDDFEDRVKKEIQMLIYNLKHIVKDVYDQSRKKKS